MPGTMPAHEPPGALHGDEEPPDADNEGPSFAEMDPTGRYGRVSPLSHPHSPHIPHHRHRHIPPRPPKHL